MGVSSLGKAPGGDRMSFLITLRHLCVELPRAGPWGDVARICSLFLCFLATLRGLWDLSSPTRDLTCVPCSGSTES